MNICGKECGGIDQHGQPINSGPCILSSGHKGACSSRTMNWTDKNGQGELSSFVEKINAYAKYIFDWSVRKGFRNSCGQCGSKGYITGLREGEYGVEAGSWPCKSCNGSGALERNFGEQVALVHSELSEMLETHRKDPHRPDDHCPEFSNLEIEAADVIIRVLDMAAAYKWRIGEAIEAKMAFNEQRPHKHGKAY